MKFVVATLVLLFFFCLPVNAQVAGGSITGTVSGESGAAMPDVHISVQEVTTGLARIATTNTAGLYNVPDLSPGNFEMTVSASGFTTQLWTSITVTARRRAHPQCRACEAGKAEPVVRVVAPPALVSEPCPAPAAAPIPTRFVTRRSTGETGRRWRRYRPASPRCRTAARPVAATWIADFGAAVSISGSRPDENAYILDGVSINDYANGAPGSVLGDNLGIDAVQQVAVLGSNYPAEYGRTSGGVISVETTKGADAFHGSVYEFLRNSALDARNFFDGPVIPAL